MAENVLFLIHELFTKPDCGGREGVGGIEYFYNVGSESR